MSDAVVDPNAPATPMPDTSPPEGEPDPNMPQEEGDKYDGGPIPGSGEPVPADEDPVE